jgi:amino acid adenylation domain-containing protein
LEQLPEGRRMRCGKSNSWGRDVVVQARTQVVARLAPIAVEKLSVRDTTNAELLAHARFVRLARQRPDLCAVATASRTWTYRELDLASVNVAVQLRDLGLEAGDTVVVDCDRSVSLVIFLLATVRTGAMFLVHGEDWPADYLTSVLESVDRCFWLSNSRAPPQDAAVGKLQRQLIIVSHECPEQKQKSGTEKHRSRPTPATGNQAMYLATTSGTTGAPKLVRGSHLPVSHFLDWYRRKFRFAESDRFALLSGLGFDPMLRDIFMPLSCGASLWIPSRNDVQSKDGLSTWLARSRISVIHATPALANRVFQSNNAMELPDMRLVALGGAVFTRDLARRISRIAKNSVQVNFYGATETPQAVAYHAIRPSDLEESDLATAPTTDTIPIGRAVEGFELTVIDENRLPCRMGEAGEICVRSRYLSQVDVAQTGSSGPESLRPLLGHDGDEVYATGDLGFFRADQRLVFVGRKDRQVKCRGYRLHLEELEAVISQCPCVKHVAVTAYPLERAEVRLTCYIAPCSGFTTPIADVKRHVLMKLPTYMLPEQFVLLEYMPLTRSGKIDFAALPLPGEACSEYGNDVPERISTIQSQLLAIWASILDVAQGELGVDRNFFDGGGDSLLVGKFAYELDLIFERKVRITDVFMHPNVRELALYLSASEVLSDVMTVQLRRSDSRRHRIAAVRAKRAVTQL